MTDNVSTRVHADLALAVYLEPHAEGRRVLLLGDAEGALADRFDRLATQLEIIDPGAREPSRGEVPELPFDDRSFDLVLVCDAAALPEPTGQAVRELRRVLSRTGLLAVVDPIAARRRRRGGPTHAWLEKLLSTEFRNVRLLAQSPLSVYSLGELERARGEEISVDSSLMRDDDSEPERLLGLASETRFVAEPRLWVEVPFEAQAARSADAERSQAGLVEELQRAEDEARDALHREADLLRKLEVERKARGEAEHLAERARVFERKLLAAEADYDDAVARVRYFEGAIGEREAAAAHDRERREGAERELAQAKSDLASATERLQRLEAERDAARSEYDTISRERDELEQRLTELGKQVLALEGDKKHHEQIARDLLEELRRLEHDKSAAVEHDARVAELEAERERAVQRALEAEVAREAAQMRADELRAELAERVRVADEAARSERSRSAARDRNDVRPAPDARVSNDGSRERTAPPESQHRAALSAFDEPPVGAEGLPKAATLSGANSEPPLVALGEPIALGEQRARVAELEAQSGRLRGECHGLRLRLNEAEIALEAVASPGEQLRQANRELEELRLRHAQTDAAFHALREVHRDNTERAEREPAREQNSADAERVRSLEEQLRAADQRLTELTRELDEADRFAEVHAEDAERLNAVEAELERSRERLEDLEQELRASEDELRAARDDLERAKDELARSRAERDEQLARAREVEQDDLRRAREEALRATADATAKLELSERREAERDDARAALAEARAILAQLASRVGADENDPPSIVQALLARDDTHSSERERMVDALRGELAQRDRRIEQLERWLHEARDTDAARPQPTDSSEY